MPVVHSTRTTAAAGATLALALAGLVAPAMSASAAGETLTVPTSPVAAGSAFVVKAEGLADAAYSIALTTPGDTNRTNVAESTDCTKTSTSLTCTLREATPGSYEAKLYNADGVQLVKKAVTVDTPVAITSATGPKANDNGGSADSLTLTYIKGVKWETSTDGTTWTAVDFGTNPAAGATKDVAVATAASYTDVQVRATAEAGYVFPDGAPTYTLRLTGSATPPAALTIPSDARPVKIDAVGLSNDKLTLTNVPDVDWYVDGVKISFGAGESSKTIAVSPSKAKDYVVTVQARALAPRSFSGGRLAEDFDQTYSDAKGEPTYERLAGDNRELTAVEVSKKNFAPGRDAVYVANGYNFPDALAAGPAAAKAKSPLLLAGKTWINDATLDEVKRLAPKKIFLVGGSDVVNDDVAAKLAQLGSVTRLAGSNRYATAVDVALENWSTSDNVYIAYGLNFPDALSGGSGAAKEGGPLLLSDGKDLSDDTLATLKRLAPKKVVLVGGENVLATSVKRAVELALPTSTSVVRAGGTDRYDTSALIIKNVTGKDGQKSAFLATGRNYPDALAGVPAAFVANAPLALTQPNCLPASVKSALDPLPLTTVTRLGGSDVVGNFSVLSGTCG